MPISGLPELLFDEGFQAYKSFCMEVSSYAIQQNTQHVSHKSTFIPFDKDKLLCQSPEDEEDINMLFMTNETVIFKDGKGINREVTFLGPHLSDGILKHKFELETTLNSWLTEFYFLLWISQTLQLFHSHQNNTRLICPKLTELELMQISTPQTLDTDQQEFM